MASQDIARAGLISIAQNPQMAFATNAGASSVELVACAGDPDYGEAFALGPLPAVAFWSIPPCLFRRIKRVRDSRCRRRGRLRRRRRALDSLRRRERSALFFSYDKIKLFM